MIQEKNNAYFKLTTIKLIKKITIMNEQKMKTKAEAVGSIIGILFGMGIGFVIAVIFDINPAKEYGWFAGFFHGCWLPINWIMSWFSDSVLIKAPLHTTAYNVWWWINAVFGVWFWIKMILMIIANARVLKQ